MEDVLNRIRSGSPVLIFDGENREGETDIVVPSQFITYEHIGRMRKDGGGLICTTLTYDIAEKLGLKYLVDIFRMTGLDIFRYLYPNDIPYDEKSAFSITINHRKTFTGIPDRDRALTISEFSKLIGKASNADEYSIRLEFGKNFRSPGHVHLLIASRDLLKGRRGHTELSTTLMLMAGLIPSATIVEMLGDDGYSLPYKKAKDYAMEHNYPFIEGNQIVEWWENWSE
ncbi:MAG: 3,4-dihydroxy-2-butanone-4-phosphate synthase [Aciduliprofundum sp.]|jgi:3,4-dihydroxy 2-butanone 4-phosphate synthase|nr:MAG: 3,4-dihydroxy-2-butanone-4-phosphate synthase [Aciduliprofundum sp.]